MPQAVFMYYPFKALGESTRLLLTYGGIDFEDKRVTDDEWPKYKPTAPFGQMPILKIDGQVYAQGVAISRYLGKKFGLGGNTLEEDLRIDEMIGFIDDIRFRAGLAYYEKSEPHKKTQHELNAKTLYPFQLSKLSEIIEKNNGHLALGRLTWADFVLAGMYDFLKKMLQGQKEIDEKYPAIKRAVDKVHALPQLQAYLASRPVTEI